MKNRLKGMIILVALPLLAKAKIHLLLATMTFSLLACAGCEKVMLGGRITVKMTDAPADFSRVDVEIRELRVHYSSGDSLGWVTLQTRSGVYNLLELQHNTTALLASQTLPLGKITEMKLVLGDSNSVILAGIVLPLDPPDDKEISIGVTAYIKSYADLTVVLDFDAGKSLLQSGEKWILRPHVVVKSISQF